VTFLNKILRTLEVIDETWNVTQRKDDIDTADGGGMM